MRSNAIYLYQVIEEIHSVLDEPNENRERPSDIVHSSYLNAIKELDGRGYICKTTNEDQTEMFYKQKSKERDERFSNNKDVFMAYIKRLTLMKDELKEIK